MVMGLMTWQLVPFLIMVEVVKEEQLTFIS